MAVKTADIYSRRLRRRVARKLASRASLLGSFCGTARAPAVERAELGFVQCTHICGGPHWVQASAGIAAALLAAGQATRHLLWPPTRTPPERNGQWHHGDSSGHSFTARLWVQIQANMSASPPAASQLQQKQDWPENSIAELTKPCCHGQPSLLEQKQCKLVKPGRGAGPASTPCC
jgi:hypothetical protein